MQEHAEFCTPELAARSFDRSSGKFSFKKEITPQPRMSKVEKILPTGFKQALMTREK